MSRRGCGCCGCKIFETQFQPLVLSPVEVLSFQSIDTEVNNGTEMAPAWAVETTKSESDGLLAGLASETSPNENELISEYYTALKFKTSQVNLFDGDDVLTFTYKHSGTSESAVEITIAGLDVDGDILDFDDIKDRFDDADNRSNIASDGSVSIRIADWLSDLEADPDHVWLIIGPKYLADDVVAEITNPFLVIDFEEDNDEGTIQWQDEFEIIPSYDAGRSEPELIDFETFATLEPGNVLLSKSTLPTVNFWLDFGDLLRQPFFVGGNRQIKIHFYDVSDFSGALLDVTELPAAVETITLGTKRYTEIVHTSEIDPDEGKVGTGEWIEDPNGAWHDDPYSSFNPSDPTHYVRDEEDFTVRGLLATSTRADDVVVVDDYIAAWPASRNEETRNETWPDDYIRANEEEFSFDIKGIHLLARSGHLEIRPGTDSFELDAWETTSAVHVEDETSEKWRPGFAWFTEDDLPACRVGIEVVGGDAVLNLASGWKVVSGDGTKNTSCTDMRSCKVVPQGHAQEFEATLTLPGYGVFTSTDSLFQLCQTSIGIEFGEDSYVVNEEVEFTWSDGRDFDLDYDLLEDQHPTETVYFGGFYYKIPERSAIDSRGEYPPHCTDYTADAVYTRQTTFTNTISVGQQQIGGNTEQWQEDNADAIENDTDGLVHVLDTIPEWDEDFHKTAFGEVRIWAEDLLPTDPDYDTHYNVTCEAEVSYLGTFDDTGDGDEVVMLAELVQDEEWTDPYFDVHGVLPSLTPMIPDVITPSVMPEGATDAYGVYPSTIYAIPRPVGETTYNSISCVASDSYDVVVTEHTIDIDTVDIGGSVNASTAFINEDAFRAVTLTDAYVEDGSTYEIFVDYYRKVRKWRIANFYTAIKVATQKVPKWTGNNMPETTWDMYNFHATDNRWVLAEDSTAGEMTYNSGLNRWLATVSNLSLVNFSLMSVTAQGTGRAYMEEP